MRVAAFAITAAVVVGLSAPALAQQASASASAQAQTAQTASNPATYTSTEARHWMASGFLGTNFGSGRTNNLQLTNLENFDSGTTSATFGGQVAYLARGVIGGEFLAEFSPRVGSFNNVLFERSPNVNTYMFNLIAASPFGEIQSFDPYISGGIGWVGMHADIFTANPLRVQNIDSIPTQSISAQKFGWDLGGGIMAWSEKRWGFRGDLRYYRSTSGGTDVFDINNIGDGATFTDVELSGISFWRANAGLAFRW